MAPKRKDTEDTIDKPNTRRPQIVLRTLPPIVFTSPTNPLTFQLTMSVSGVKPLRCTSPLISSVFVVMLFCFPWVCECLSNPTAAPAPQLEGRPSYERDFGISSHEVYADTAVVQREFDRVNERVDDVKKDLKATRDALDQKISGLETRLTTKIDEQKSYMDRKFEQQEEKFQRRMSQLQLNLENALETQSEDVAARLDRMDKRVDERLAKVDERFAKVDERFNKVDERFNKVDERFDKVEGRLDTMEKDIGQIKQMLQQLLMQGGAPPTPLPSASSQVPLLDNPPEVVVHAASAPASSSSAARQDVKPTDSPGSRLLETFRIIRRQTSLGMGALAAFNKSKDRLDQ